MYIYNITIKVDQGIHEPWLEWMGQIHIPAILETGKFTGHQLLRIREIDDQEGPTYALQLFADSKASYNAFVAVHLEAMQARQNREWGAKMLCFSTLMEIVH